MAYFLREDIDIVESKIHETIEKLRETGAELRTAVTQSSETWHDNFGFENAQQQARLLGQRLHDLEQMHRNAVIVAKPQTNEVIAIGHTVTVKDIETGTIQPIASAAISHSQKTRSHMHPLSGGSCSAKRSGNERVARSEQKKKISR